MTRIKHLFLGALAFATTLLLGFSAIAAGAALISRFAAL